MHIPLQSSILTKHETMSLTFGQLVNVSVKIEWNVRLLICTYGKQANETVSAEDATVPHTGGVRG